MSRSSPFSTPSKQFTAAEETTSPEKHFVDAGYVRKSIQAMIQDAAKAYTAFSNRTFPPIPNPETLSTKQVFTKILGVFSSHLKMVKDAGGKDAAEEMHLGTLNPAGISQLYAKASTKWQKASDARPEEMGNFLGGLQNLRNSVMELPGVVGHRRTAAQVDLNPIRRSYVQVVQDGLDAREAMMKEAEDKAR